jgi:zeaxanthin epoxidase
MVSLRLSSVLIVTLASHAVNGFVTPSARSSSLALGATTLAPPKTIKGSDGSDVTEIDIPYVDEISESNPLRVVIAGAGVGGLALSQVLSKNPKVNVTVFERTDKFKRFGGPIQLASNALQIIRTMDQDVYEKVMDKFTTTGDKTNGIKDGIRTEWYAKFDLAGPAESRGLPYTGVIDRPDLQEIYLQSLPEGVVLNGDGVESYEKTENGVTVTLSSGKKVDADVLIGADGIWSAVRATMRNTAIRGEESGVTYSGYTVFAGELAYDSFDNGEVGYKVYIGPNQFFVITDIGKGNYQWYAFLARPPGSAETEEKPDGKSKFLQGVFAGWSEEVHHILRATKEHEIEQRDLYDRPPSVLKPWSDGKVALLGDGVHAMMPNLGQGGCQAIEDAFVLNDELSAAKSRSEIAKKLQSYQQRRLVRSAAVQGLSRFASDIIIRGFDTPAKIVKDEKTGAIRFENCNYSGIVTRMLQPILPIFFAIQFNFLYSGWKNDGKIDVKAALGFITVGGLILLLGAFTVGELGLGLFGAEALLGAEGFLEFDTIASAVREFLSF